MMALIDDWWIHLSALGVVGLSVVLIANVILTKRDVSAVIGWVGLILLSPIAGSVFYLIFGINRIRRRAARLNRPAKSATDRAAGNNALLAGFLHDRHSHLSYLARVVDKLSTNPLVGGNRIEPLRNGDRAYPEMIRAIDAAKRAVLMQTYIFRCDAAGEMFVDALSRAVKRGVAVRLLIDGFGVFYSFPSIRTQLRDSGIPYGLFMHSLWPWRMPYLNLRNHQKILVVDGETGFTGGLNIGADNLLETNPAHPVRDTHFRIVGPVVTQMVDVFRSDWQFTTGETLDNAEWVDEPVAAGHAVARGLTGGPDLEVDKLRSVLVAAISEAQESVRVVTPYFLPDEVIVSALSIAARRGVDVDIIVPGVSNLHYVDWAASTWLDVLVDAGCRIWRSPPPFDHSKLMIVDGTWSFFGSVNWDPRSLRLNFEFNIECFDTELADALVKLSDDMLAGAQPVTVAALNARPLAAKLRDGVARLFSPYL
jgi:cardiolipin synthase A/B